MNSWDFPNSATPVGSTLYYGIRFSPPALHNDLAILAALHASLVSIPNECRDETVANAKLHWWREEMERIYSGEGQHPLAHLLTQTIRQHSLPREPFADLLDSVQADIAAQAIANISDLIARGRMQRGALFELFAHCHGLIDNTVAELARRLGAYVHMVDSIRNLGLDLSKGRLMLPADLLRSYQLNRSNLHWEQYEDQRRAMLRQMSDAADRYLVETLGTSNRSAANALVPARIMAAISQVVLDELRTSQFPVMHERLSITPLRKVWVAWRTRRQARKS